jgi:Domain of unknown function (DUF4276)
MGKERFGWEAEIVIRVYIVCEGQTEELFVNEVLSDFFAARNIYLTPILIGKPGHKGGNFRFGRLLTDLRNLLGDSNAYCTTLFDFYGLPSGFPGKERAQSMMTGKDKAQVIVQSLMAELEHELAEDSLRRFIPYIQMYEFEGLLFSDCNKLALAIGQPELAMKFQQIRASFDSPEDINDSKITAPSKRLTSIYPIYDKVRHGSLAALEIGLTQIRAECSLFDHWLQQLEKLEKL